MALGAVMPDNVLDDLSSALTILVIILRWAVYTTCNAVSHRSPSPSSIVIVTPKSASIDMSDQLPGTISEWKKAAKGKRIGVTQQLAAGAAFVSGSKFQFEHLLRLRVLYQKNQLPEELAKSPWFPSENLPKVVDIFKNEPDTLYLREFLKDKSAIKSRWDVGKVKKSGAFAIAMENLHLITTRKMRTMDTDEDNTEAKIVMSPRKGSQINQSGAHYRTLSHPGAATPTPLPRRPVNYLESPPSVFDITQLSMTPREQEGAQIHHAIQKAENEFQRSDFSPGDEQTVNAALVALMMALSWLLESTARVHHDRVIFSIPSESRDTDLYKTAVDGLILHSTSKEKCAAFMEVKRDLRGTNQAVRRQIAAQMAAFIFQQDVALAEQGTDQKTAKKTEEAKKGKKKQATKKGKQKAETEDQIEYEDTQK